MTIDEELDKFPLTGRFLAGRLRQELSLAEREILEALPFEVREYGRGDRVIARGDHCHHSTMLVEGFMLRTLEDHDRRFGVSFHVPGDFVDLHCFPLRRLDHNVDCVGPAKVALVSHDELFRVMDEQPHLARLLWFSTLLDAAMHREWIMKLGQLTAPRRIAHIFAEIWHRLEMVGLALPDGFDTPLRQEDIGVMSGTTGIHANRSLQTLRRNDIAHFDRGRVRVADRGRLESYAEFAPDYLYGEGELSPRNAAA